MNASLSPSTWILIEAPTAVTILGDFLPRVIACLVVAYWAPEGVVDNARAEIQFGGFCRPMCLIPELWDHLSSAIAEGVSPIEAVYYALRDKKKWTAKWVVHRFGVTAGRLHEELTETHRGPVPNWLIEYAKSNNGP